MTELPPVDELIKMSEAELDELHDKLFEEAIAHLDEEQKQVQRAKQWRRMMELRKLKNPLARASRAYGQMVDSLNDLNEAWNGKGE